MREIGFNPPSCGKHQLYFSVSSIKYPDYFKYDIHQLLAFFFHQYKKRQFYSLLFSGKGEQLTFESKIVFHALTGTLYLLYCTTDNISCTCYIMLVLIHYFLVVCYCILQHKCLRSIFGSTALSLIFSKKLRCLHQQKPFKTYIMLV